MEEKLLLPSEDETAAIALKPKTAALCYDRVWGTSDDIVPRPIRCWGGTQPEMSGKGLAADYNIKTSRSPIVAMVGPQDKKLEMLRASTDHGLAATFRDIAKSFSKKHGIYMVPIFDFVKQRNKMYQPGDREVIVTTLSNLQIVDDDQLTWEQVIEFRKDKENQQKYKRLLNWLDKDMVGKPQSLIEGNIALKLEDYEAALKKNGIKTKYGTIELVLDLLYLVSVFGNATLVKSAADLFPQILLLGGYAIGRVSVKLKQMKLNYNDIERGPNSEICWVYQVGKLS